jgi:hypothetical protein
MVGPETIFFQVPFSQYKNKDEVIESKSDLYSKDRIFFASFAFFVITFEPIMISTCSAPQNDHLNYSFVKDIKVVVEKMTRNCRKTATFKIQ